MTRKVCGFIIAFALVTMNLMIVFPIQAELTPSVPQFTVKYVDNSYDIPPNYTTDPYTGGKVSTNGSGEHISDRYVVFTIKNQPFTIYTDPTGKNINLYYNFRFKGHYGGDWIYYPFNGTMTTHSYGPYSGGSFKYYPASTEEYTTFSIKLGTLTAYPVWATIPEGSVVDFEVQAQVGHIDALHSGLLAGNFYNFTGEASDWSSTQKITIGAPQSTTAPALTPSIKTGATQTPILTPIPQGAQTNLSISISWEIIAIVGLVVAVVVLAVGLGVVWRKLTSMKNAPK